MNTRLFRRIALALVAVLVYAQASVALAGCLMDRGAMAQSVAQHECCDTEEGQPTSQVGNVCLVHCTADLQLTEQPPTPALAPPATAVLFVPLASVDSAGLRPHATPALAAVPPRILFQTFRI